MRSQHTLIELISARMIGFNLAGRRPNATAVPASLACVLILSASFSVQ
jgi:hypothetical protein